MLYHIYSDAKDSPSLCHSWKDALLGTHSCTIPSRPVFQSLTSRDYAYRMLRKRHPQHTCNDILAILVPILHLSSGVINTSSLKQTTRSFRDLLVVLELEFGLLLNAFPVVRFLSRIYGRQRSIPNPSSNTWCGFRDTQKPLAVGSICSETTWVAS